MGFSAALVLLAVCNAFPISQPEPVALIGEAEGVGEDPDENMWFHALEDRPAGERVIPHTGGDTQSLGEGFPSPEEESSGMEGARGSVKGTKEDSKQPQAARTPREPEETRNPFGQMLADMKSMKKSEHDLFDEHKNYEKLKYYAAPQHEQDAVNEAVTAMQTLAIATRPSREADQIASDANQDLIDAVDHRKITEEQGRLKHHFTTKDYLPAPDRPDPNLDGPFTRLWKLSHTMAEEEAQSKKMMQSFKTKPMAPAIRRAIEPNEKKRQKLHASEDVFYAHKLSKDSSPKWSKRYYLAKKKAESEDKMMNLLSRTAVEFKNAKENNYALTYKEYTKGTPVEGITNFYAMSPVELERETAEFKQMSDGLHDKEAKVDAMQESYIKSYSEGARMVPLDEWQRKYDIQRKVNAEVPDPDEPVTEQQIAADALKLKQKHEHPDLEADARNVLQATENAQQEHDEAVARIVSQAPTEKDFAKMKKEKLMGAAQLEEDTKVANKKLEQATAHPDHFGPDRKFDPSYEPAYTDSDTEIMRRQHMKWDKENRDGLIRDAENLEESGSHGDLAILDHDTEAAQKGHPVSNMAVKNNIVAEQSYYKALRKVHGREVQEDVKKGIYEKFGKEVKAWNQVKESVLDGGISPSYGAEALKSLPTSSKGPELDDDAAPPDATGGDEPLRKDEPPNSGASRLPEGARTAVETSTQEAGAEDRPRTGYAPEDEDTPASEGKTVEEVAAEQAAKDEDNANSEARVIEGTKPGIDGIAGKGDTDDAMKKQYDAAAAAEQSVQDASDPTKGVSEVESAEMPTVPTMKSDSDMDKEAAAEIDAATKDVDASGQTSGPSATEPGVVWRPEEGVPPSAR